MKTLFHGVYAPTTIGTLLHEFSFGHARQLEPVLRDHLCHLCHRVDLLPGADHRVFIDIDSLLRPVYGHAKHGASYGHSKIAGKQILRKGLSPLATTISTTRAAPVIAGMRLRQGKARIVTQAIVTARALVGRTEPTDMYECRWSSAVNIAVNPCADCVSSCPVPGGTSHAGDLLSTRDPTGDQE
jgi:hypothetical protein